MRRYKVTVRETIYTDFWVEAYDPISAQEKVEDAIWRASDYSTIHADGVDYIEQETWFEDVLEVEDSGEAVADEA